MEYSFINKVPLVLYILVVFSGHVISFKDNAIDEGKLEDDFSLMDFRDEISKRAPSSAVGIYKSLKHSFISLAKPNAKISVSRRRRSRSWFWSSRRRRFSRGSRRTASSNFNPRKDMVFVMDRSGSVGQHHFKLQKTFIKQLIEYFDISRSKTLVAILTFASNVKLEFDFNKYPNKECLRNGIENIRYTGGLTATGPALHYVLDNLIMSHSTGARSNAIDGYSNTGSPRNPSIPAGKLKARGVQVHIMGVTTSISKTELNSIASKPNFVYHATNGYSTLSTVIRKLKKGLSTKCKYGKDNCRIRKEFNDLTNVERIRYITTIKTASTNSKYKRKYERLLTIHRTIFSGKNIHRKQFFLPWHR
ncbi:sushi, von Willebrand factor type A, EGF and pentraxin domain-containing protein 1-like [Xenia sp. Carnegie-2017]|uniref:sushi, von Willebrand factor type A, EGF and pentraxin domain-containing protein 1-like n=1 Tax=Xenia sp. Carnegie-2017 TaxID=2897299 RepID=UPI001F03F77A|nr:sushi, von Willebrand factor type A, EGF and pentraxin domain-containing protein 1-like [Xenia sp. Carnegie-2017]